MPYGMFKNCVAKHVVDDVCNPLEEFGESVQLPGGTSNRPMNCLTGSLSAGLG